MESRDHLASQDHNPRRTEWWAIDELCEQQVRQQHAILRQAATDLREQLAGFARRHRERLPVLGDMLSTFDTITATLVSHLAKEENILFPAFTALAAAWRDGTSAPPLPFPTVRHPISLMESEHDRLDRSLARLRELMATVSLPPDVSAEWKQVRAAFEGFERELEADTSFEDDVLFPRALELERALL